ncbi:hypothetical protein [Hyalangium versicolor]|uniref:hypothetical protein n=1 Tax=Hyalangium versicolor TaxID=2861190 RepID=UPI001CCD56F1|nr:hypothetical protein [Hyalangium versicolor]
MSLFSLEPVPPGAGGSQAAAFSACLWVWALTLAQQGAVGELAVKLEKEQPQA